MATTTFLFVDQVRSTEQLTRLGDEAAHELRRALFDLLRQATEVAGGHEVDFTGDGLFCAFAGAAEAVEAAVLMQQLAGSFSDRQPVERRLAVRTGLNSGEPLQSAGGGYFGAAVVVAARLCEAAAEGQILASDVVRSLVEPRGARRFRALGELSLKGVPEPVRVAAVEWEPDRRRADLPGGLAAARSGPYVGRRRELAEVRAAWAAVRAGARRLVLISGDHGIGVTRFAAEAAHGLWADGAAVWHGQGSGRTVRLGLWSQALTGWAEATSRAELRLAIGSRAGDLLRLAPAVARLLPGVPEPAPIDPAAELFLVQDALDQLCTRWSAREPVVAVLDRLEEADRESLLVLRRLLESRRGGRLLVLGCYEPAEVGATRVLAEVGELPGLTDLRLTGLGEAEVRELVTAVAGSTPAPSVRAVLDETEGNPSFVLRMATALRERTLTRQVTDAVGRAEELRTDLRLQREEIALGLRQLEQLRTGDAVAEAGPPVEADGTPPAAVSCPYKGLVAFQPGDAEDFFGRELLVAELVARLVSARFLAVVGPSGSGKSSAVRAGLLPALAAGAVPGSGSWVPVVCTPGAEPITAVLAAAREEAAGRRLVLVVDQFEQLWTAVEPDRRSAVLDLLAEPGDEVTVVVVLRADYYGRTAEHAALALLTGDSQVLVGQMTPAELRLAIEAPARRAGLVLEPGLTQAVIDDLGHEPGGLPLLSTALLETWERRRGRSLTLAGYAETGGARRAIAHLAEAFYAELADAEQDAARRLLLRLAAPGAEDDDVARPAPLAELTGDEESRRVLARLADRRLVTLGQHTAQVAHEALLREWPRLRGWLGADREGRRLHHQIATAAGEWAASGREDEALLRGVRLAAAADWDGADLTDVEREYVTASLDARQAELRRARRTARRFQGLAAGLVVLLVGALGAVGFAVVQGREAAERAEQADARGLAAQAISLAGTRVDTALLLAVEGYRRDPSIDTEGGLLSALNGARYLVGYRRGLPRDGGDLALTPDRKTLVVLTVGGELRRYDTTTWQAVGGPLVSGIRTPSLLTLSRDGRLAAYAAEDGVHVVELATGRQLGPPRGGTDGAAGYFSRDGRVLVTTSFGDPGARAYDLASGREIGRVEMDTEVANVDVRPTADEMVVAPFDDAVLRRHRLDGTPLGPPVTLAELGAVYGLSYTPDGRRIAVIGQDGGVQFVDAVTLARVGRPVSARGSRVGDLAFTPSGRLVAAAADDGSVRIAETETGRVVATYSGLAGLVVVEFLDDFRLLAWTGPEAAEFDLRRTTALGRTTRRGDPVWTVLDPAAGRSPVVAQGERVFELSPELTERPLGVRRPDFALDGAAISPDGRTVGLHGYSRGGAGRLSLVDVPSGAVRRTVALPGDGGQPTGAGRLTFSPDGRRLAVGTFTGRLAVIDVASGRLLVPGVRIDSRVLAALRWSADGGTLYAGGQQGLLRFVAPGTGAVRRALPLSPEVQLNDVDPVPGTSLLAVSSEAGLVFLVDLPSGRVDGEPLSAGGTQLQGVAVTPDGARIAAVSRDGAVRLWDRASRRPIGPPLEAHDVQTLGITYLDGGRLMTGGLDGTVVSWDLSPAGWVQRACALAGRDLTDAEWQQYLPDRPYRRTCTDPAGG